MDENALDVRRRGWAGVETGIAPVAELRPAIGVVQIDNNVGGIEEHDQVLRKVGDRVDAEVSIAQEDGAGLGDGERGADDGEVYIREIPRRAYAGDIAVAPDFRHHRAHDFGARDLLPHRRQDVAGGRRVEEHSAHAVQAGLEGVQQGGRRLVVERGNVGKRPVDAWQIGTDRGQDVVAAAHCFAPRFALYQL